MKKKLRPLVLGLAFSVTLLSVTACNNNSNDNKESNTAIENVADETTKNSNTTIKENEIMKFELIKLPYANDALEPAISKTTIELHHGKHLNAYVTNLNKLIDGTEFADMELVDIVKKSEGGIFNNAGQTLNHNLYFTQFSPDGGGEPTGDLMKAIEKKFGSFDEFKKTFEKEAAGLFGAGWTWLTTDKDGNLEITKHQNAGNPVTMDLVPLLGADVWEHAYYVDYQNRRADHLAKIWDIINWKEVSERYAGR